VRQVSAVLLLCLSVALVGATPTPSPSPAPSPAPAAPIVIVYPFSVTGEIKGDTGVKAAQLFVQQMREGGGVTTIDGSATVKRSDYPADAKSNHAEYYLSGYMTALGDGVALVEQLVSVHNSTIVYANSAQIQSFNDAAAQAHAVHDAIIADQNRFSAALNDQQSAASATPTPLPGNEANIGGLFKHRGAKATPKPKATPASKPAKGIFVVRIAGDLTGSELTAGTRTLLASLDTYYNATMSGVAGNAAANANGICGTQRDNTVASGSVKTASVKSGFFHKTQYTFTLDVYTCFGAPLSQASGTADSLAGAIQTAVQSYATSHPNNA
jgi:hypothetical protein